jgi:chorismate-pyruvate lyase
MTSVRSRDTSDAQLKGLIHLFYDDHAELGQFHRAEPETLPPAYRELLDHQHHMTVTVEKFYGEPVDVVVLEAQQDDRYYWRHILLARQSDRAVVQFGIARLDMTVLRTPVRRAIESRKTPLGRILIQHGVLRQVELLALWRVEMGTDLRRLMNEPSTTSTFGRTALIHCNGEPAVELLEIMTPPETVGR